ncbi:MAG TPA: FG-GAP-like repeat-containing protein [Nocardioides sp.]|uniref:FG-GAP-like repeat-containing protein n=1 Tax=Nocardioides sp. TaxID=35761 RepID=UPI002C70F992|nr:FG-GAP-like repeat-containing protein [Nocardioides sp.]HQR26541.1 FG-GAP-like repeat-containing protein [Nocardioides sp.]
MRPGQARFVTACQQLLVLGAVLAVLTPAASVISLDVVVGTPSAGAPQPHPALRTVAARVPLTAVDPVVDEYLLTAPVGHKTVAGTLQARVIPGTKAGTVTLLSRPQVVTGYGAVGVTWAHGQELPDTRVGFQARTRTGSVWSGWTELPYDEEHGPDPDSPEGRHARPGTDPLLVGEVDQVQVRAEASAALPPDMKLAVIDPGASTRTALERPAIDTAQLPSTLTTGAPDDDAVKETGADLADGDLALRAATYTPEPKIFSRAQWGADESMRDKGSLHYFEVHAGFVHHTVNANDYTRAQVPALLRGIYAYHTQSRGWSDIGYNFLVDRFGRIWEGRYGGVDRPVVGAHTLGYNDYSFAMSAIGNYETAKPTDQVLRAYGALFAWKLSLHGVAAGSPRQVVGPSVFRAINGHRDAASTACPGRYLYAQLPTIRAYAAADQQDWSGRERQTDLVAGPQPDLLVRRAADRRVFVLPTGGLTRFRPARTVATGLTPEDTVVASPDLTGDGEGDLLVRGADGVSRIWPGTGSGGYGTPIKATSLLAARDQVAAVGDLDEDGHNDLVGRVPATGRLDVYLGDGTGGFDRRALAGDWSAYRTITGAGDADGDGHVDLLVVDAAGTAWLRRGDGRGAVAAPQPVTGDFAGLTEVTGIGDFNRDGRDDLFVRTSVSGAGAVLPSLGEAGYGHPVGRVLRVRGLDGVTAADVAGSRAPDVVGRRGGALVLLRNAGGYETGAPVDTGLRLPQADLLLNVGDWDRDGHGDLVARRAATGALMLHLGDGRGHFGPAIRIGTGFGDVRLLAAVGDMTGDGLPDLMGQPVGGAMRIYPGAGTAGLWASYVAYRSIDAGRQIGVGRWDDDGAPDSVLRRGAALLLYPGNGPGGLVDRVSRLSVGLARYDWVVGLGDASGDGHADVVVRERATGLLWLLRGSPTGFAPRWLLGEGMGAYDLVG